MSPQLLQGDPAWRKLMAERRFDVALPERCAEAQPRREVEHDLQVRAASPRGATCGCRSWTSNCASWLISKPIFRASDSNGVVTGSTMSAISAVGVMNRSAWTKKSRPRRASRPRTLSAWAITIFSPKLTAP
jgi:hypothetical protein